MLCRLSRVPFVAGASREGMDRHGCAVLVRMPGAAHRARRSVAKNVVEWGCDGRLCLHTSTVVPWRRTMTTGEADASSPMGEDKLCIEMLGAGQEVGRSCCVLKFKGFTIVCDAGGAWRNKY